jgi:hypothetical protein
MASERIAVWQARGAMPDLTASGLHANDERPDHSRPLRFSALTLLGLAAVPGPPRHFELEPGLSGLDRFGAVLDPRAAGLAALFCLAHPSTSWWPAVSIENLPKCLSTPKPSSIEPSF